MRKTCFCISLPLLLCIQQLNAQSNQSSLINKWLIVGLVKKGNIIPDNKKKKEYEFLKGSKINIYENGAIDGTGTYTMATDQRSVLLNIDGESLTLKIIKLTSTELRYVVNIRQFLGDTMICYPSNSALAKNIAGHANAKGWENIVAAWNNVVSEHQKRSDLVQNISPILKGNEKFNKKAIDELEAGRIAASSFRVQAANLTSQSVAEFQNLQRKFRTAIRATLVKVEESDDLKTNATLQQLFAEMEGLENKINVAVMNYNRAVGSYNSSVSKSMQKDIGFKAEAVSDKEPEVKF